MSFIIIQSKRIFGNNKRKYIFLQLIVIKNSLIRLEDRKVLANYRVSADVKTIKSSPDSKYLVIGGIDGSLIFLIIADPNKSGHLKSLSQLPTRLSDSQQKPHKSWKMAAKLAVMAAKRQQNCKELDSKVCLIS